MYRDRLHFQYVDEWERKRFVASPQAGADAWASSAGAAQTKWSEGVQNTQKDIVGRAIANSGAAVSNYTDAIASGRWAQALSAVGNAGIKAAAAKKAGNYATGIAASKDKYLAKAQKLYPYIAQAQSMVEGMPSGNLAASKARVLAYMDFMAAGKGTF